MIEYIATHIESLNTGMLVILAIAGTWAVLTIYSLRKRIARIEAEKPDRKELNGVRKVVNEIAEELGQRDSKTRLAVVGIATKINAPEVLKEFLK